MSAFLSSNSEAQLFHFYFLSLLQVKILSMLAGHSCSLPVLSEDPHPFLYLFAESIADLTQNA